jgi:hypothetical protein
MKLKCSLIAVFAVATAFFTQPASGVVIMRDFVIAFDMGTVSGQSYNGSLSYDDANLTGTGSEVLGPNGGPPLTGFLSFEVTIESNTFSLSDDTTFPLFPILGFTDGALTGINYSCLLFGPAPTLLGPSTSGLAGSESRLEMVLPNVSSPNNFPAYVSYSSFSDFPDANALSDFPQESAGAGTIRLVPVGGVPEGGSTLAFLGLVTAGLVRFHRRRA